MDKKKVYNLLLNSLLEKKQHIHSIDDIISFVGKKNNSTHVFIQKIPLRDCINWRMSEEGIIENYQGTFFSISGIRQKLLDKEIEQPIIIQNEIGFLGIIAKEVNNNLYFLMQAKIEPGNVNKIQLSPTIQATKSNFTQSHGGKAPAYLDYFINANRHFILFDQILSEQSSRFLRKRNRNMIIIVENHVKVKDSHIWISLNQLKQLLKIDNLINMDTRTVLSCLPLHLIDKEIVNNFNLKNKPLSNSFFGLPDPNEISLFYNKINDFKMFDNSKIDLVSLNDLSNWRVSDKDIMSIKPFPFKVIFANIEIEGREVTKWSQPLFEANGNALFGLFISKIDESIKVLVKLKKEIGSFDIVDLGPTVQKEPFEKTKHDEIEKLFYVFIKDKEKIKYDVMLSEEGGRFYHEQNRNVIIEIDNFVIENIPNCYLWLDIKTISFLIQTNNVVNIQLRNLISLLEVY